MKTKLIAFFSSLLLTVAAFGHGDVALGPNKGLLLEFNQSPKISGEVREVDGKFQVQLFDAKLKSVELTTHELTATGGERSKPQKLTVEKKDGKYFVLPTVKSGQFVIFQFKVTSDAKPSTARFKYDTTLSDDGKTPAWLHVH